MGNGPELQVLRGLGTVGTGTLACQRIFPIPAIWVTPKPSFAGAPAAALWREAVRMPGVQPGLLGLDGPAEAPGQAPPQRRQQDQAQRATHAAGTLMGTEVQAC